MIVKKQLKLEALLFALLGAVVGFFVIYGQNQKEIFQLSTKAAETASTSNAASPAPTSVPTTGTASQISSDGKRKVVVKTTANKDGTRTYEVSTADDGSIIFAKILEPEEHLSIPFNTWSANNTYFFLQEESKTGTKILAFQADGEPFADGEAAIDVTNLFANSPRRAATDTFAKATGWAESNLLVINTKLPDGTQGASYWVEIPSKAVLRLSTKF